MKTNASYESSTYTGKLKQSSCKTWFMWGRELKERARWRHFSTIRDPQPDEGKAQQDAPGGKLWEGSRKFKCEQNSNERSLQDLEAWPPFDPSPNIDEAEYRNRELKRGAASMGLPHPSCLRLAREVKSWATGAIELHCLFLLSQGSLSCERHEVTSGAESQHQSMWGEPPGPRGSRGYLHLGHFKKQITDNIQGTHTTDVGTMDLLGNKFLPGKHQLAPPPQVLSVEECRKRSWSPHPLDVPHAQNLPQHSPVFTK